MKLNVIDSYGQPRRRDFVRVVKTTIRGVPMVSVQWKEGDRRRSQSFNDSRKGIAEAKAYAEATSDRLAAKVSVSTFEPITVRQLFEKYINAKCDSWRPRTLDVKKERWQLWELFINPRTPAHLVTREHLDDFKRAMIGNNRVVNQVKLYIENAMTVFRWGVDRDLIPPTKVTSYRTEFSKDAKRQTVQMAEYTESERLKILAAMDPKKANHWRAWALTTLFAYCGPRENAALHLEWKDVTLDGLAGSIRWNPDRDKMGHERHQPLPQPVAEALWVAYGWRLHDRYEGRWVFYGARAKTKDSDRPFTFQSYTYALHEAEKRAGVKSVKHRAAHGFRRGIAGDVHAITGSEKAAADWIGDKSVKVVRQHYLLHRDAEMERLASIVGKNMQTNADKNENVAIAGDDEGVNRV